jgi:hypothetical protein
MFTKIITATVAFAMVAGVTLATIASAQATLLQQEQWSNVLDESVATSRKGFDAPIAQ